MTQSTSSPRRYHKGNVADDLRKAAERILATESLEDITIRRLTKEVGVAPANFYNHFGSVDELLLGIAASSLDEAVDRATATWLRSGTKPDLLIAAAIDFIRFCVENRQLMRLMLGRRDDGHGDPLGRAPARSFDEVARFIYGVGTPETASACDCERYGVAVGYIALTYGLALIVAERRFPVDVENETELAHFVRNGILPFLDGSAAAILSTKP